MAKIIKRTNCNLSLDNKPKIWFSAHPDDYQLYLEDIINDLFCALECIVHYDAEPTAEYDKDSFPSSLEDINLFVTPITRVLLETENRALTVEIDYAKKQGIPIFPILMEDGIETAFNEKFGDLHLLKRSDSDYSEKLRDQLSSVLIGEDLAEEIRREFGKRIFLSYRKADKKDARELMHLIHEIDFCRDVAIWYDEYLTAGENFNEEIRKNLLESDLFVLAITENITEKRIDENGKRVNNYVVMDEFPLAKNNNKRILPLRMALVSTKRLENAFHGIPTYVNARNERALADALIDALGKDIEKKKVNTPLHDLLIGLAYLGGIDVEINRQRALELIKSAANRGNERAMEKLVSMYRNGEAVELDYQKAVEWQRRLVSKFENVLKNRVDLGAAESYVNNILALSEYLKELGRQDEIKDTLDTALPLLKKEYETFPIPYVRRFGAVILSLLAEYHLAKGEYDEAMARAKESLDVRIENAEEEGYEGLHADDLLSIYSLLVDICRGKGDYEGERIYKDKMLQFLDGADERCSSEEEYALLLMRGSGVKELIDRRADLEHALEIFKRLAETDRSVNNLRNLATCYSLLAEVASKESKRCSFFASPGDAKKDKLDLIKEIKQYSALAIEMLKEVSKSTGALADLRILAKCYGEAAGYVFDELSEARFELSDEKMLEKVNTGDGYFEKSIEIFDRLVNEKHLIADRRDLAWYLGQRSFHVSQAAVFDIIDVSECKRGAEYVERAIGILDEMIDASDSDSDRSDRNMAYGFAHLAYELLEDEDMKEYYAKKKNMN